MGSLSRLECRVKSPKTLVSRASCETQERLQPQDSSLSHRVSYPSFHTASRMRKSRMSVLRTACV